MIGSETVGNLLRLLEFQGYDVTELAAENNEIGETQVTLTINLHNATKDEGTQGS